MYSLALSCTQLIYLHSNLMMPRPRPLTLLLLLLPGFALSVRTDRSRSPVIQRRRRQNADLESVGVSDIATSSSAPNIGAGSSVNGATGIASSSSLLSEFSIGLYDEEPDATTCCSQLVDVLTGPYFRTHGTLLGELATQVYTELIGPDLRKSLLMIFIQHHREQFRRIHSEGLSLSLLCVSVACNSRQFLVLLEQDLRGKLDSEHRYLRWRTSLWQRKLLRRCARCYSCRRCRGRRHRQRLLLEIF